MLLHIPLKTSGLFYYTLGNLPPKLRSSLKSIHLLNVCRYTDIEKYGIDVILEPFVEEIKELEKVFILQYMCSINSTNYVWF